MVQSLLYFSKATDMFQQQAGCVSEVLFAALELIKCARLVSTQAEEMAVKYFHDRITDSHRLAALLDPCCVRSLNKEDANHKQRTIMIKLLEEEYNSLNAPMLRDPDERSRRHEKPVVGSVPIICHSFSYSQPDSGDQFVFCSNEFPSRVP